MSVQDLREANQQVTTTELAWLAGFIDGEGCLALHRSYSKKHHNPKYTPSVSIVNTDVATMERIGAILASLDVPFYYRNDGRNSRNAKHADCHSIQVYRITAVLKLITLLYPYLFTKKHQAGLLLTFVNKRARVNSENGDSCKRSSAHIRYDPQDHELFHELQRVKHLGTSTTTRETPKGDDIVCSA